HDPGGRSGRSGGPPGRAHRAQAAPLRRRRAARPARAAPRPTTPGSIGKERLVTASSEKGRVLGLAEQEAVRYVSFQFTDILGVVKSVTIPIHQFEAAIDHGLWFDGSSVEGFTRIHESDMYLQPDLATFGVIPWEREADVTARVICDVYTPDGEPFDGDPRELLRRQMRRAEGLGWRFQTGPELAC